MAEIKVNLEVADPSGSTKARTNEARTLNKELERAKSLATGTQSGGQALKSSYKSAALENREYGSARGVMESTGAGARDFAKQAEGLGGIVRLYATWAANIYAVGAAFRALSEAANITNMVEGMNQLGAASGVALGSIAKRFSEATGGAISFQDAITATVKATSSGMSASQFERLGQVATNASRALGVGMSDAVSRLTRGITKLEPELIDELGLFTKVGTASEEYAKKVGKSVASLTDFEKRQAYANAVLAEGEAKFGKINVAANPYDALIASIKNLTQSGLEMINKVLGPVASFLSSSPTALAGAMAAISVLLVKQAIPAIGQYRESLAKSLEESRDIWQKKAALAKSASEASIKTALSGLDNVAQIAADKAAERLDILETLVNKNQAKFGKTVKNILKVENLTDISEDNIRTIEKFSQSNKGLSRVYTELALSIRDAKTAQADYNIAEENAIANQKKRDASILSNVTRTTREARAAELAFTSKSLISQASNDVGIFGISGALSNLKKNISDVGDMSGLRKAFTMVGGTVSIATTAVTGFLGAISGIMMWVGVAVAAFVTLNSIISSNSEQLTKFSSAIDLATESTKTGAATAELYLNSMSVEAIAARANAIDGISNSMRGLITALDEADRAAGFWDRLVDSAKDLFGQGLKDQFTKTISAQINTGLSDIDNPEAKARLEGKLKSLLNINGDLSIPSVQKALDNVSEKNIVSVSKEVQKEFAAVAVQAQATKGAVNSISDAFKNTETNLQNLTNSLLSNDPISKYGMSLAAQGIAMQEAFKDPIAAAATLRDILRDVNKIKLFPPETAQALLVVRDEFAKLTTQLQSAEKRQAELNARVAQLKVKPFGELYQEGYIPRQRELKSTTAELGNINQLVNQLKAQQDKLITSLGNIATTSINNGISMALKQSRLVETLATISNMKALVDSATQTVATVALSSKLEQQRIDIEIEQVSLTQSILNENKIANELAKQQLLKLDIANLKSNADPRDLKGSVLAGMEKQLAQSEARAKALATPGGIQKGLKAGELDKTSEAIADLNVELGYMSKLAELAAKKIAERNSSELKLLEVQSKDKQNELNVKLSKETSKLQETKLSSDFLSKPLAERQRIENEYNDSIQAVKDELALLPYALAKAKDELLLSKAPKGSEEAKALSTSLAASTKSLKDAKDKLAADNVATKAAKERADEEARISQELKLQTEALELSNRQYSSIRDGQLQELDLSKQNLELTIEKAGFSTEAEAQALKNLDLEINAKQKIAALEAEAFRHKKDVLALEAKTRNKNNTIEDQASLAAQLEAENSYHNTVMANINAQYDGKAKLIDQTNYYGTKMKSLEGLVQDTFQGMTDAIMNFVKTGKLDFEGLVTSFIEGLIRIELQMAQMQIMQSMGGSGGIGSMLLNVGASLFGGPSAAGAGTLSSMSGADFTASMNAAASNGTLPIWQAKGGAWDSGVMKFAKGGTFTNSVVSSPTLFKFAKGTGMMGEAGPEAIMPLKRDSNGSLGVAASTSSPKVEVNITNNTTERAETKETVDSRGNRKIEVVIGEMVAAELGRSNSPMQASMRNNFGVSPTLTRRG